MLDIKDITNQVIQGDCIETMQTWPAKSINCCVTSPPYWGLRDYGVDGQLGLEKTPEEFVAKMVAVFAEVKRVLRDDGTLWLNLGDSYAANRGYQVPQTKDIDTKRDTDSFNHMSAKVPSGLKAKDLVGIPWMVAFALRQDGWYLRQDIIWHKPNPMPESVRDRCTKAHEYIFLLTKKPRYYYDAEAIKEPSSPGTHERLARGVSDVHKNVNGAPGQTPHSMNKPRLNRKFDPAAGNKNNPSFDAAMSVMPEKRNKRSVWTVTTKPYSEAHFATFPPDLIEPCILAGCPKEVCVKCGKARVRVVESEQLRRKRPNEYIKRTGAAGTGNSINQTVAGVSNKTTGWTDCGCGAGFEPGIVLDPFMGSGTTAMVAYENNRNYVGCELNPEYIKLNRADKAKEKYGLFE